MTTPIRIVIVDDNPDDRALESRLLSAELPDLQIVEIGTPEAWAAVLAGPAFDVVITDYHLAWSDGLAILHDVHSLWPERPVIMVTGTGNEDVAVEALKAGVSDYVLKHRDRIVRLPMVVRGALQRAAGRVLDEEKRAQLDLEVARRERVSGSLAKIEVLETPEATADAICREIQATLGLGIVAIEWFMGSDTIVLALAALGPAPVGVSDFLPTKRSEYLQERASRGPWLEDWETVDQSDPYATGWVAAGIEVSGYVPMMRLGRPVGLLIGAGAGRWSVEELAHRLPVLMEYATLAAAYIEPAMSDRSLEMGRAADVREIIAQGSYHTVFQPIVRFADGEAAGYEALTRFDDNISPAVHFAAAHSAGVGVELELATLGSSMAAAAQLPAGAFVSLNASSALLFAAGSLAPMAATFDRPIVVELTEHEHSIDEVRLLELVKGLGGNVRLAMDDAGAGYAGLHRILQLRPAFIKLDIGLVRDLDRDPARAALIAGMIHFAGEIGSSIIAEGIEREGERRALRRLGVTYGQGYLLGRPAPVETWVSGPRS